MRPQRETRSFGETRRRVRVSGGSEWPTADAAERSHKRQRRDFQT